MESGRSGGSGGRRAWIALVPMLAGTYTGTLSNSVVNAPLNLIRTDLNVSIAAAALVAIGYAIALAVLMPISGWLGDRFGRRRTYAISMGVMALSSAGAALAPDLGWLVALRAVQGAACAAILPTVMGLISRTIGERHRGRAIGLWAAVNGIGQASGPVIGGALGTWLGWRAIFWPLVPLALLTLVATLWLVPRDRAERIPLDGRGATLITATATFGLGGIAAVPSLGIGSPVVWTGLALGLLGGVLFVRTERRHPAPLLSPRLLVEARYVRSCAAVCTQMFGLACCLLAVPLYLTGEHGRTAAAAGLAVLVVPVMMALLAPVAGLVVERGYPRWSLRGGHVVLIAGHAAVALALAGGAAFDVRLLGALLVVGVGTAFVQTAATTGVTRSQAGRAGAGLGMFNLIRFTGNALGAAWTAVAIEGLDSYGLVFAGCAGAAALGLACAFAGRTEAPPRG